MSNYEANSDRSIDSNQKKRRKINIDNQSNSITNSQTRWKTDSELQIYSVKFLQALRRNPTSPAIRRSRTVRETADRILASSAKGRTRWSRAILSNRLSLKLINKRHKKVKLRSPKKKAVPAPAPAPLPPLQRKVKVLGQLVPGCNNLSLPNLLEETSDYIAALEMQVRALNTLAGILTVAGTSTDYSDQA
ncbi:transcription factor bHLH149-like [Impatiens glandulifera]|uniref:transcription factor bHLH149-like n=1 Tax=Impatiens glandulifera TaxID=253017 RepID=UPI001FB13F94|nr:transcription factor bHLH149-like [Impatiens glandulifera]